MADKSGIEWTDATWNPVTGCTKVSAGCKHCYAERDWARLSAPRAKPNIYTGRAFTDVRVHLDRLDQPLAWTRPRRVFVNSMSDLFHDAVTDAFLDTVFHVMHQAREHVFQVLTKRPARMLAYVTERLGFVPRNVWLGVSVEDQATADERIPLLLQTPAAVRWVSAEPLLGPLVLDVSRWGNCYHAGFAGRDEQASHRDCICHLDWVVVGGESGPKARPMHPDWVQSLRDQCQATRVPFFFKQWGEHISASDPRCPVGPPLSAWTWSDGEPFRREHARTGRDAALLRRVGKRYAGRLLDGRTWDEYPEAA